MLLTSVRVEGLRSAPVAHLDDLATQQVLPPGLSAALADGLCLFQAAVCPSTTAAHLHALGIAGPDTTWTQDQARLDEVEELHAGGVRDLVAEAPHPHVTVHLSVVPDPPMFGTLRDLAVRDPRWVAALGSGAALHIRLGWLFNRAATHASVAVLAVQVGEERFSPSEPDTAAWLPDVLTTIGGKIHRLPDHTPPEDQARGVFEAQLSSQAPVRAAAARAARSLARAPFGWGTLEVVRHPEGQLRLAFGPSLTPLRTLGPDAARAVELVHAVEARQPDILVAHLPPRARWRTWTERHLDGTDATLAQVLWLPAP